MKNVENYLDDKIEEFLNQYEPETYVLTLFDEDIDVEDIQDLVYDRVITEIRRKRDMIIITFDKDFIDSRNEKAKREAEMDRLELVREYWLSQF